MSGRIPKAFMITSWTNTATFLSHSVLPDAVRGRRVHSKRTIVSRIKQQRASFCSHVNAFRTACAQGRDHTLFSLVHGNVQFHEEGKKGRTGFVRVRKMVSIIPAEMQNDASARPPAPPKEQQQQQQQQQ